MKKAKSNFKGIKQSNRSNKRTKKHARIKHCYPKLKNSTDVCYFWLTKSIATVTITITINHVKKNEH